MGRDSKERKRKKENEKERKRERNVFLKKKGTKKLKKRKIDK